MPSPGRADAAGGKLPLAWCCRTLLLPLLLLWAQQGALLHELSHFSGQDTQKERHSQHPDGPCGLCIAFAQVASATAPLVQPLLLLAGLAFVLAAITAISARAATPPARCSRGPPVRR